TVIEKSRVRRKPAHAHGETVPVANGSSVSARTADHLHLPAMASVIRLEQGLYALEIAGGSSRAGEPSGAELPLIQVSSPPIGRHVERVGDRRFTRQGWVGNLGRKLRIEAFSIRPIEALVANDIEVKGLGPHGRETPWVGAGRLCGTRGQRLPLTGFAVRLAP